MAGEATAPSLQRRFGGGWKLHGESCQAGSRSWGLLGLTLQNQSHLQTPRGRNKAKALGESCQSRMGSYRATSRASCTGQRNQSKYMSSGLAATKCMHWCPSPPKQEDMEKGYSGVQNLRVHEVHMGCPLPHHALLWCGGLASSPLDCPQASKERCSPQASFGMSC